MSEISNQDILDFIVAGTGENYYVDKSQRIARKVMVELVKAGRAEFLLLRDDEVASWWSVLYNDAQSKMEKHNEKVRVYNLKMEVYNKLSTEERRSLGIRKPVKPKDI